MRIRLPFGSLPVPVTVGQPARHDWVGADEAVGHLNGPDALEQVWRWPLSFRDLLELPDEGLPGGADGHVAWRVGVGRLWQPILGDLLAGGFLGPVVQGREGQLEPLADLLETVLSQPVAGRQPERPGLPDGL